MLERIAVEVKDLEAEVKTALLEGKVKEARFLAGFFLDHDQKEVEEYLQEVQSSIITERKLALAKELEARMMALQKEAEEGLKKLNSLDLIHEVAAPTPQVPAPQKKVVVSTPPQKKVIPIEKGVAILKASLEKGNKMEAKAVRYGQGQGFKAAQARKAAWKDAQKHPPKDTKEVIKKRETFLSDEEVNDLTRGVKVVL